ncbi:COX15/CtaA family protein [Cognatilysobacter lacus]|uniref:Heme A synthase n=1 Tax=Cognatilysobacter lacus TaxID=1643323 RepID=A0A5D8ZFP8_9GAMM|nr:COX15/CtaA family protein [Lysobacter lacus]TZF91504.1 heme A synthase [Lysobacter lacus]
MGKPRTDAVRTSYRHFHRLAWLAAALAFGVIVFGAFVRLSNAGLSCPDWPTCYGRAAWPTHAGDVASHAANAIRVADPSKAWREQLHRHLAASLGTLVFVLALLAVRRRKHGLLQVLAAGALVGASIPLYMHAQYGIAAALAIAGELILLAGAIRWNNSDLARVACLALMTIVFQALLGMWTVTWLLKPIVVTGHLVGGMTTFALLLWMAWRATDLPIRLADAALLRRLVAVALVLLGVQVALGGWVSSNYAALACGNDFPTCVGTWTPPANFHDGFAVMRGVGVDYEGGVLDGASRIAIHLAHRMWAAIVFVYLLWLSLRFLRMPGMRGWGTLLGLLTLSQVALGIANVKLGLPLHVAVSHNAGAALLLATLVTLAARIREPNV